MLFFAAECAEKDFQELFCGFVGSFGFFSPFCNPKGNGIV
jgi:hypothetical protein